VIRPVVSHDNKTNHCICRAQLEFYWYKTQPYADVVVSTSHHQAVCKMIKR
jgi:hypothetical protein